MKYLSFLWYQGVKHVVLLNCGATIDICDFLDPPDDVIFYILDNHRPVDVTNIYNDGQVVWVDCCLGVLTPDLGEADDEAGS